MDYISKAFPDAEWDDESVLAFKRARDEEAQRGRVARREIDIHTIEREIAAGAFVKPDPWEHQRKALLLGRDLPYFAYIMDQGTGKTRTICDDAAHNFRMGRIDALLVINKNSVKTNWVTTDDDPDEPDAIDTWLPPDVPRRKALWLSDANKGEQKKWADFLRDTYASSSKKTLFVMSVNYDALLMERCYAQLEQFCKMRRVMIVCDESTMIGRPSSDRTKQATKLRKLCPVARILTGTPIVKSPLKAYSQFAFLNEDILGFGSFYAFKARYCIMGGFQGRQIIKYVNLDELSEKIASCSFRVTKDECLDLPPKVFQKRRIYMTAKQEKAYGDMRRTMLALIGTKEVSTTIQLTQVMRLQQITGGYVKADDGSVIEIVKPADNPLIRETMELLEERGDQKFIVWAHFHEEIDALYATMKKAGLNVAIFDGRVNERERLAIRRRMKNGELDGIIGQAAAGGMGIDEFKIASLVIYYSNSYDTEARVQSEDRTHRGGSEMHECITYYDLIVPNTVRVKIIQTLRANRSVSDEVMRDGLKEWI